MQHMRAAVDRHRAPHRRGDLAQGGRDQRHARDCFCFMTAMSSYARRNRTQSLAMQVCADLAVIPAQAGIKRSAPETLDKWIPGCAGMTWEVLPVESDPGTLNGLCFVL